VGKDDIDINQEFNKTNKAFANVNNYKERIRYIRDRNVKIFNEIKENEYGINIEKIEEKLRNENINIK